MPPAWNQSRKTVRRYRLSAERLEPRLLLSADSYGQSEWLRTDGEGNAYFIDPLPASPPSDDVNDGTDGVEAFGGVQGASSSLDDVPILHSDPLAAKKILLDFNGHTVVGTSWNSSNNGNPIHAPAFDKDGDIFSFNDTELSAIVDIWEQVVEDFSPFQVDITTEDPGEAFFAAGSQGIRLLISDNVDDSRLGGTGNKWFDDAGGVAYINSWTTRSDTPAWVFSQDLGGSIKKIAEASSHEIGHTLGLSHDGQTGGVAYYEGHGSGNTGWAPIMGTAYHKPLSQWSRGEYTNANNLQNDLSIMSGKIAYRDDDHSDSTSAQATPLTIENSAVSASGLIETSTDRDVFSFSVDTWKAEVVIQVNPWHNNPNLDVLLELRQSNGVLITSINPTSELSAVFEDTFDPGTYYVTVQGTGEGDPDTGYSDYGSIGQYTISGSVNILRGDVNNDGIINAADIDLVSLVVAAAVSEDIFDLDENGIVESLDVDELVLNILDTRYGDANLDGTVDGIDFGIWQDHRFENDVGWANGDFNGDLSVDGSDFNIWLANRFAADPPEAAAQLEQPENREPRAPLGAFGQPGGRGQPEAVPAQMIRNSFIVSPNADSNGDHPDLQPNSKPANTHFGNFKPNIVFLQQPRVIDRYMATYRIGLSDKKSRSPDAFVHPAVIDELFARFGPYDPA